MVQNIQGFGWSAERKGEIIHPSTLCLDPNFNTEIKNSRMTAACDSPTNHSSILSGLRTQQNSVTIIINVATEMNRGGRREHCSFCWLWCTQIPSLIQSQITHFPQRLVNIHVMQLLVLVEVMFTLILSYSS